MDAFLALIAAIVVFALLIFLAARSWKSIVVLGLVIVVVLALRGLGVFG